MAPTAAKRFHFDSLIQGPATPAEAALIARLEGGAPGEVPPALEGGGEGAGTGGNDTIRAALIRDLCTSPFAARELRTRGLKVSSARISEELDLSHATVPFPLTFENCTFEATVWLHHAKLTHLAFRGGRTAGVYANGARIAGDLVFSDGILVKGTISLISARVCGSVRMTGARVVNRRGSALVCESADVGGSVLLDDGFCAVGEVSLYNTHIRGDLLCNGSRLYNPKGSALAADFVRVDGAIYVREAKARGEVRAIGAECRGNIELDGSDFRNDRLDAVCLEAVRVKGSVFLRGSRYERPFLARGGVRLVGADIGLDLICDRADIAGPRGGDTADGYALAAPRMRVTGNVRIGNLQTCGRVLLAGARVGGTLRCVDAVFDIEAPTPAGEWIGRTTLSCERVSVQGSVEIHGGGTNGVLDFRSARVGRNFMVRRLRLAPGCVNGLLAEYIEVGGELSWAHTTAGEGTKMLLSHARIGQLRHGSLSWPVTPGRLRLTGCRYGTLELTEPNERSEAAPPATVPGAAEPSASAPQSLDAPAAGYRPPWPPRTPTVEALLAMRDLVRLTGRGFRRIGQAGRRAVRGGVRSFAAPPRPDALRWLDLQDRTRFDPQPYEHLALVLHEGGYDDDAKQVAIELEEVRYSFGSLSRGAKRTNWMLGRFLHHGHSTRRVWVISAVATLVGALVFWQGYTGGVIVPSREDVYMDSSYVATATPPSEYPSFSPLFYSLDAFLPVIDLHQEMYWLPNPHTACRIRGFDIRFAECGMAIRWYLWAHIIFGWIATTLIVISVTGAVRRLPIE